MYKIDKLVKLNKRIFHTSDLALAWEITNKNTLYTTIKRYIKKGILIPIQKGLYSTLPISNLDPLQLAAALIHKYTYLTTESVLAQNGIIAQKIEQLTFVSSVSTQIKIKDQNFLFRKLKDQFLYNPYGIENRDGVYIASVERAIADMLYFNPKYHFDLRENIDFKTIRNVQKNVGYI